MPPPRRFAGMLVNRSIPLWTRVDLLVAELRRRLRPRTEYRVRYGAGALFLSHDDYEIDWETLKNTLADEPYLTDYRGAVVLDIGAHKGYFGAYAIAHGAATVISFEPESENARHLQRSASIAQRHGKRWHVEKAAVSGVAGEAELHVMGASWGHALDPPEAFTEFEKGIEHVSVLALSHVLRGTGTERPNQARLVVKINTEGEECKTVLGTPPQEWEVVDELLVETHPWADCGANELAAHLAPAGLTRMESRHERMLQLRRESPRSDRRIGSR